jgi:hypothetical protein
MAKLAGGKMVNKRKSLSKTDFGSRQVVRHPVYKPVTSSFPGLPALVLRRG